MEDDDITFQVAIEDLSKIYKWIYFNYMLNFKDNDYELFMISQVNFTKGIIEKIHSKYADHVEAQRIQLDHLRSML
jgi:hypothetical protein